MKRLSTTPIATIMLAALAWCSTACGSGDDEATLSGEADDGGSAYKEDARACREAARTLMDLECPLGFFPLLVRGDDGPIVSAEDAAIPICGDVGVLVDFDTVPGAELVGYGITQNSVCAYGCFSRCGPGVSTCSGKTATGGSCGACGGYLDEQSCHDFVAWCQGIDADQAGAEGNACGAGTREEGDGDGG